MVDFVSGAGVHIKSLAFQPESGVSKKGVSTAMPVSKRLDDEAVGNGFEATYWTSLSNVGLVPDHNKLCGLLDISTPNSLSTTFSMIPKTHRVSTCSRAMFSKFYISKDTYGLLSRRSPMEVLASRKDDQAKTMGRPFQLFGDEIGKPRSSSLLRSCECVMDSCDSSFPRESPTRP